MAVGAKLLIGEALAGTTRAQLDRVIVFLDEWQEALHQVELASLRIVRGSRLVTHRAREQSKPLFAGKAPACLDEAVDVARGKLDRTDGIDKEWAVLPLEDERVVVAQGDLRPNAAHQQAVVGADLALVNVDEVEVQVGEATPILVVRLDESNRDLVDDLVGRVLFDGGLHRFTFVWFHVLRCERLAHELQALTNGFLVSRGAVLAE